MISFSGRAMAHFRPKRPARIIGFNQIGHKPVYMRSDLRPTIEIERAFVNSPQGLLSTISYTLSGTSLNSTGGGALAAGRAESFRT